MRAGILFLGLLLTLTVLLSFSGGADEAESAVVLAPGPAAPADSSDPAGSAANVAAVSVLDFEYRDGQTDTLTTVIPSGETVFWIWSEGTHSVTGGTGTPADAVSSASFDSGLISANSDEPFFSHTFGGTGVYEYYCTLHPAMRGTVVVI